MLFASDPLHLARASAQYDSFQLRGAAQPNDSNMSVQSRSLVGWRERVLEDLGWRPRQSVPELEVEACLPPEEAARLDLDDGVPAAIPHRRDPMQWSPPVSDAPFGELLQSDVPRVCLDRTWVLNEFDRYAAERSCLLSQICQTSGLKPVVESMLRCAPGHANHAASRQGAWNFNKQLYSLCIERSLAESMLASQTAASDELTWEQAARLAPKEKPAQPTLGEVGDMHSAGTLSRTFSPDELNRAPAYTGSDSSFKHSPLAQPLWGSIIQPAWKGSSASKPPRWWRGRASLPSAGIVLPSTSTHERSEDMTSYVDLSLLDDGADFAIYEYMEQAPLLLSCVGMAHGVATFFRSSHLQRSYDGPALGPFDTKPEHLGSKPVPNLLGGELRLQPGTGLTVLDSSLVRAPMIRHQRQATDFLLVRPVKGHMCLRRLKHLFAIGQLEPLTLVCPPSVAKVQRQCCIRQMIRKARLEAATRAAKRGKRNREGNNFSQKLCKDVQRWWCKSEASTVRQICHEELSRDLEATKKDSQIMATPEDVCVLDSMERGKRYLESLEIFSGGYFVGQRGRLRHVAYDRRFESAVAELAELEARSTGPKLATTARWISEQLQCAPWHVTSEHSSVLKSRSRLWSVSGLGDPLGSRGDGVSFLHVLQAGIHHCTRVSELQQLSDGELKRGLKKLGATAQNWRFLGRWEQISLLQELEDKHAGGKDMDKKSRQNPKTMHADLLQATFDRQLAALRGEVKSTDREQDAQSPSSPSSSAVDSDQAEMLADLEAELMAHQHSQKEFPGSPEVASPSLPSVLEAQGKPKVKRARDQGEASELQRLRSLLDRPLAEVEEANGEPDDQVHPSAEPVEPARKKVKMLRVVTLEKTALGKFVEREQYVAEKHISAYLNLKRQASQHAATLQQARLARAHRLQSRGPQGRRIKVRRRPKDTAADKKS